MKKRPIFYIVVAGIFFASCAHKQNNEQITEMPDNLIKITREQFETGKLVIGEPGKMEFDEEVRCNGNILVEPSGTAIISTTVPGLVKRINCTAGQKVSQVKFCSNFRGMSLLNFRRTLLKLQVS